MEVSVRDNNVEQALRVLKKKMQREGVFREMKNRRVYEKPSEKKKRILQENNHFIEGEIFSILSSLISNSSDSNSVMLGDDCAR